MEPTTYDHRKSEAVQMEAIERTADNAAGKLRLDIDKLLKAQKSVETTLGVSVDPLELEDLQTRLNAAIDRARQARLRLDELERKQASAGEIKMVTWVPMKRAQVVITYLVDDTRKISFTRHVHWNGAAWVGRSTLTNARVTYPVNAAAAVAREAA